MQDCKISGNGRDDLALAEVLALFHDIGRFEQLKVFGSFDDRISVDHAKLGLKVLNSSGVFCDLARSERRLLCRAIWLHNKYEIPETERGDAVLFSRLIRDADKLDILGVINEHFECRDLHPNSALDFGMKDKPGFLQGSCLGNPAGKDGEDPVLKTMNDMRLMLSELGFRYLLSRHLILHRWERLLDEAASQSTRRSGNIQSEEFRRRIPCQKKADLHLIQEFFISCNLMNSLFSPPPP